MVFWGRQKMTCLEHFTTSSHLTVCEHAFLHIVAVLCYSRMTGETCLWFISSCIFIYSISFWGKCGVGEYEPVLKVFTSFKRIVPSMQENYSNWSYWGARPDVDCVQVTFTPLLSALQEVFSD